MIGTLGPGRNGTENRFKQFSTYEMTARTVP